MALEAVIFDVDGTLVDSERHGHRVAFNLAFEELGLPDRWDEERYGQLLEVTGGQRRIDTWLAGRGVPEDQRRRLAPALHARKTEIITELIEAGRIEARPGVPRLLAELSGAGVRLAVATTGSRSWVERVLDKAVGDAPFEVVVSGDDVADRKPDPEAFVTALTGLGLDASVAVAVEDSAAGLASAKGASLACVVVVNSYTADHDLAAADLVLDGFGEPGRPASVLHDPHGNGCGGVLDRATLERLLSR